MIRRPVRLALVCLGLLATAGIGYRLWMDEGALSAGGQQSAARERTADEALASINSLRTSLQASVGAGQDAGAWSARALTDIDTLHRAFAALHAAVQPTGGSAAEAVALTDPLSAAVKRVRAYVLDGQPLLAADVIFTEISGQLDVASRQALAARDTARAAAAEASATLRRQEAALGGAALLLWMAIAVALVSAPSASFAAVATPVPGPADIDLSLSGMHDEVAAPPAAVDSTHRHPLSVPPVALREVAEVCADLSALADEQSLGAALARACGLIDATGAIVWLATADGRLLAPGLVHGYDARVIGRIGSIPSDGDNLTGRAFRDGVAHMSVATVSAPAALAVPMIGPTGPVGVLSAELAGGHRAEADLVSLGIIFAAQLATLALPHPAAPPSETDAPRQARA